MTVPTIYLLPYFEGDSNTRMETMTIYTFIWFEEFGFDTSHQKTITVEFCLRSNHCPSSLYNQTGVPLLVDPLTFIRANKPDAGENPELIPRGKKEILNYYKAAECLTS